MPAELVEAPDSLAGIGDAMGAVFDACKEQGTIVMSKLDSEARSARHEIRWEKGR